jgi:uncharacterized Tic20 family protein
MGLLLLLLCITAVLGPLLARKLAESEDPAFGSRAADRVSIPFITGLMVSMLLVGIYKVFQHWRRANSTVGIRPSRPAHKPASSL